MSKHHTINSEEASGLEEFGDRLLEKKSARSHQNLHVETAEHNEPGLRLDTESSLDTISESLQKTTSLVLIYPPLA